MGRRKVHDEAIGMFGSEHAIEPPTHSTLRLDSESWDDDGANSKNSTAAMPNSRREEAFQSKGMPTIQVSVDDGHRHHAPSDEEKEGPLSMQEAPQDETIERDEGVREAITPEETQIDEPPNTVGEKSSRDCPSLDSLLSTTHPLPAVDKVLTASAQMMQMVKFAHGNKADARHLLKECEEHFEQLKAEKHESNMRFINLETEKVEVEALLMKAEQKIMMLQSENESSAACIDELESKKVDTERRMRDSEVKLILMSFEAETYGLKIQELEASKAQMERKLQAAEDKIVWLEGQNQSFAEEYMRLELTKAEFECRLGDAENEARQLKKKNENLTSRLEQIESDVACKDEVIQAAESMNKEIGEELKSAHLKLKSLRLDKDASDMRIRAIESEKRELQRKLDDKEKTINRVQNDLDTSNARVTSLESKSADLINKLKEAKESIGVAQYSNETAHPESAKKRRIDVVNESSGNSNSKVDVDENDTDETINFLRQQLSASETRLRETKAEKAELEQLLRDAKKRGAYAARRMQESLEQTKSLMEEKVLLTSEKKELELASSMAKSRLMDARLKIDTLQKENKSSASRFVKLKLKRAEIDKQIEEAQEQVSFLQAENDALSKKLKRYESSDSAVPASHDENSVGSMAMQQQKEQFERRLNESQEKLTNLSEKLEEREEKVKAAVKEKNEIGALLQEAIARNADLGQRLNLTEEKLKLKKWRTKMDNVAMENGKSAEETGKNSFFDWAKSSLPFSQSGGFRGRESQAIKSPVRNEEALAATVAQLQVSNDDLRKQKNTLSDRVDSLQRENVNLSQRVLHSRSEKERLLKQLIAFEQSIAVLKGVESRFKGTEKEVEILRTERQKLLASLEEIKGHINDVDVEKSTVFSLLAQSDEQLEKAQSHLQSTLGVGPSSGATSPAVIGALMVQKNDILNQVAKLETEKSKILDRLTSSSTDPALLPIGNNASCDFITELEQDNRRMKEASSVSEDQINAAWVERNSFSFKLTKLKKLLEMAEADKEAVTAKLKISEQMLLKASKELEQNRQTMTAKDADIEQLQSTLKRLTTMFHEVMKRTERQVAKLKKREKNLKDRYKRLESSISDSSERSILKLKAQNDRATKVMQGLSQELAAVTTREAMVSKRCAALRLAVANLEEKNKSLQKEFSALECKSTREKEAVAKKLAALAQALRALKLEQEINVNTCSTASVANEESQSMRPDQLDRNGSFNVSFDSTSTRIYHEKLNEATENVPTTASVDSTSREHAASNVSAKDTFDPITKNEQLQQAVRFAPNHYKTSNARYVVRRPYNIEDCDLFAKCGISTNHDYAESADASIPTSIEVAARIIHDDSILLLSGPSNVLFVRRDGSVEDYTDVDMREYPMGWISYKTSDGREEYYSLDEIFEEAKMHREHYCKSTISASFNSDKGLLRLAHKSGSETFSKFIYAVCSSPDVELQLSPTDKSEGVFVITAACVNALSSALKLWT